MPAGPAVSSFLYELGGFELPFFVSGSIGIFFAVCLVFALPSKKQRESIAQVMTNFFVIFLK